LPKNCVHTKQTREREETHWGRLGANGRVALLVLFPFLPTQKIWRSGNEKEKKTGKAEQLTKMF
jgi:hypothetical protein